jgi:hypothetical protein
MGYIDENHIENVGTVQNNIANTRPMTSLTCYKCGDHFNYYYHIIHPCNAWIFRHICYG